MRKTLFLVAVLALLVLAAPSQSNANPCPAIGNAAGCNLIITFSGGSTVSTALGDPNPYDGVEDQLVGVVNNSGSTLNSITLAGSDIFGFDGDGAGEPGTGCTVLGTGGTYGCLTTGPFGPTGYEGPNTSFTIVDVNDGTVNFTGGLANGSTAWFSLEESASLTNFSVTGVSTGAPEPSAMVLLGSGLLSLVGFARRRLAS